MYFMHCIFFYRFFSFYLTKTTDKCFKRTTNQRIKIELVLTINYERKLLFWLAVPSYALCPSMVESEEYPGPPLDVIVPCNQGKYSRNKFQIIRGCYARQAMLSSSSNKGTVTQDVHVNGTVSQNSC